MKQFSLGSTLTRWGRAGVAAVSISLAATTAVAQFGGGFGGANYRTSINEGELERMIESLQLDETQAQLAESLFDGFRDSYDQASDASREQMREAFREMRDTGEWQSAASTGIEFGRQWQSRSDALEQAFFNDVRSLLTEDQQALWPRYEREWRRRDSFRSGGQPGSFSGENIDLFEVVDELDLSPEERERVTPPLEAYAVELDPALMNRDRAVEDMTNMTASLLEGKSTLEEVESKFKNMQRTRVQVRDMNDRYVQLIAAHLSPERGEALQREYQRRSFRGIYSPTRAESYVESVRDSGLLNEAQLQALSMIEQEYRTQTNPINRQLADLQKQREVEDQQRMFERLSMMAQGGPRQRGRQDFGFGGGDADPRRELMQQKEDLVESTLNSVAALLNPEQLQAVPKPERDRRGRRGEFSEEDRRQFEERMRERGGDRRRSDN